MMDVYCQVTSDYGLFEEQKLNNIQKRLRKDAQWFYTTLVKGYKSNFDLTVDLVRKY